MADSVIDFFQFTINLCLVCCVGNSSRMKVSLKLPPPPPPQKKKKKKKKNKKKQQQQQCPTLLLHDFDHLIRRMRLQYIYHGENTEPLSPFPHY